MSNESHKRREEPQEVFLLLYRGQTYGFFNSRKLQQNDSADIWFLSPPPRKDLLRLTWVEISTQRQETPTEHNA